MLDQVFVGEFDTDPGTTLGCSGPNCAAFTPFALSVLVLSQVAFNGVPETGEFGGDATAVGTVSITSEFSSQPARVWAKWSPFSVTPIPEPGTLFLMGAGLAVLFGFRKRIHS